jgi:hypothetical protein
MATEAEMDAAILALAAAIDSGLIVIEPEHDDHGRNTDVHTGR